MTNLILTILITNQIALVTFRAEPWTFYRLERAATWPGTNWLAADYFEERPYHGEAVLMDAGHWPAAFYRVAGLATE